jgi:hypothetical protein
MSGIRKKAPEPPAPGPTGPMQEDEVLRRMLNTPHQPKVTPAGKPKKG